MYAWRRLDSFFFLVFIDTKSHGPVIVLGDDRYYAQVTNSTVQYSSKTLHASGFHSGKKLPVGSAVVQNAPACDTLYDPRARALIANLKAKKGNRCMGTHIEAGGQSGQSGGGCRAPF
jgi:hypothetical protein